MFLLCFVFLMNECWILSNVSASWHWVPSVHGKKKQKKMEVVTDFLFLSSKITADDDYSHEIQRHLIIRINAMTNLDSILKSRNITLPTKVYIVKAMVFPVVMNRWEFWMVKKLKNWCFSTVVLQKSLRSPLDYKEIKPVNPKGNQS